MPLKMIMMIKQYVRSKRKSYKIMEGGPLIEDEIENA